MNQRLTLLCLTFLLACGTSDSSRIVLPPAGVALDSSGTVKRFYVADSLKLIASLGGEERDTSLLDPYLLEASGDRVYVVEGEQRVQAYDTLARRMWSTGRNGGGPGEFRNIRDIKISATGEIWLNDPPNARITRIDSAGRVLGQISLQRVGYSETMALGPNATATLLPHDAESDIMTIDSTGAVIDYDTIAWKGWRDLERLSRQFRTTSDPITGRWVLGFIFGNGWFGFEGRGGSERRYYVEPTRFPAVVKDISNGGATISTKLIQGDLSGASITMLGDTVFVLFGGTDAADFRQIIDLYSWTSGNYLGSIALPESVDEIAVTDSWLYTLASHPVPKLSVFRRVRK